MKKAWKWQKPVWVLVSMLFLIGGVLMFTNTGVAMQDTKAGKQATQMKAYAVYQNRCLLCHDSVADPEKPGRTRDDWHLVVQVMHKYGLELTVEESDMIIDLLYDLRKGMEREAG